MIGGTGGLFTINAGGDRVRRPRHISASIPLSLHKS